LDLSKCSDKKALELLETLLVRDPKIRLSSKQIKEHPFFKSIQWDKLLLKKLRPPFKVTLKDELDVSHFSDGVSNPTLDDNNSDDGVSKEEQTSISQMMFSGFSYVNKNSQ